VEQVGLLYRPDEVVLGPTSARRLGARVGSTIPFTGNKEGTHRLRVTGIGFVPQGSHNDYDDGGWLNRDVAEWFAEQL